jgi:rod shape determining protein RodA
MASVTRTRRPSATVLTDRRARIDSSPLRHLDIVLALATIAIALFGVVMIYSASRSPLEAEGLDPTTYLRRQAIFVVMGLAAMAAVVTIDYRKFREWALPGYVVGIIVLVGVLTPLGLDETGVAQRWYQFGTFQLQPAEFMKFLLILMLAAYLSMHRGDLGPRRVLVAFGLAGLPVAIVMAQSDLGTALALGVIALGMLVVAGLKGRYLVAVLAILVIGAIGSIQVGVLRDYQIERLTAAIDQSGDSQETTWNLEQSKTAIANGGLTGKGLFKGTQTQGGFVPEQRTDFIFTAVGEELGFAGAATLLGLLALVVWRTWRAALLARDFFGTLICIGVLAMLVFQIFQNVGMTMGIMPITGLPLPLMSYGGSSIITTLMCIGLVLNVHMRRFT